MSFLKPPDDIFDACCTEKILLLYNVELHFLGDHGVLVEEDRCDSLSSLSGLHQVDIVVISLAVILFVLGLKGWQGAPEPQAIGIESVVPGDWCVIGHSFNELALGPLGPLHFHAIHFHGLLLDFAIELDLIDNIVALDLPWDSLRVAEVRDLHLLAQFFNDMLLEVTVVVSDTVAPGGNLQGCHGVQEARSESPEASPA